MSFSGISGSGAVFDSFLHQAASFLSAAAASRGVLDGAVRGAGPRWECGGGGRSAAPRPARAAPDRLLRESVQHHHSAREYRELSIAVVPVSTAFWRRFGQDLWQNPLVFMAKKVSVVECSTH